MSEKKMFGSSVKEPKEPTIQEVLASLTWANVTVEFCDTVEANIEEFSVDMKTAIIKTFLPIVKQLKLDNEFYKAELAKK